MESGIGPRHHIDNQQVTAPNVTQVGSKVIDTFEIIAIEIKAFEISQLANGQRNSPRQKINL